MAVARYRLESPSKHIVWFGAILLLVVGVVGVIAMAFAHALARNADSVDATSFASALSPGDPYIRNRHAMFLERTFDLASIPASLAEYEAAVGLSPYNFIYWLALGQARERDGDRPGAEKAYRRALDLAPNYARTKWALGNNLVRQGQIGSGIDLIVGAVEQDASFAAPAVVTAMQAFDGDVGRVSASLSSSQHALAEIARYLVSQGRYEDGIAAWEQVEHGARMSSLREVGKAIRDKLIEQRRFRDASLITASLGEVSDRVPQIGSLTNGGFESGVESRDADFFDWRVGEPYPLFGLSETAKEGRYSLLVRFTTPARLDLATLSRSVAVEPGARYELSWSYRSDIVSRAEFRFEVVSLEDGRQLGVSQPLENSPSWSKLTIQFPVPSDHDGITFRLIRDNCNSAACTVSGNLWLDDFTLNKI